MKNCRFDERHNRTFRSPTPQKQKPPAMRLFLKLVHIALRVSDWKLWWIKQLEYKLELLLDIKSLTAIKLRGVIVKGYLSDTIKCADDYVEDVAHFTKSDCQ